MLGLRSRAWLDGPLLRAAVPVDVPAYVHGTVHPPHRFRGTPIDPAHEAPIVWTVHGSYVFARSPVLNRILTATYEALQSGYTAAYNPDRSRLATLARTVRRYLSPTRTYGDPSNDVDAARRFCAGLAASDVDVASTELSEDARTRLEDLGYM